MLPVPIIQYDSVQTTYYVQSADLGLGDLSDLTNAIYISFLTYNAGNFTSSEGFVTELLVTTFVIQGGPKVSLHTLALIAQSLSAQSK